MSRTALRGIGQAIKANTTEKSIDDLRAEGKKRVRVVSSERVMAIIQAIVDDTINAEVGEITRRDRDRIVSDTQERFSHVLRMQQDLEQQVEDTRTSLRASELECDRLRADKTLLETQLEAARRVENESDAVERLGREMTRVRESVERTSREPAPANETTVARLLETLAARESQTARRISADFEDLRARIEEVARGAAAARDGTAEKTLARAKEQQSQADAQLAARLDREFRTVAEHLAAIRSEVGRAPAADDAVARLHGNLASLESRIHGVERGSSELADRVSKAVLDRLEEREAVAGDHRRAAAALDAAETNDALRRVHRASDETRQSLALEIAALRGSMDDARTNALSAQVEQLRGLEQRLAAGASESADAVADAVARLAERSAEIDESLKTLHRDLADALERTAESTKTAPAAVTDAIGELRSDAARAAAAASRAADAQAAVVGRVDGSLAELKSEFMALTARSIEAAERQDAAVRALRDEIERRATVQSGSLESTFKDALDKAIDQIERTMARATARPIETSGEATEVLLSKIFDGPDGEVTSNLDQLEVEERRSKGSISKSLDRLKRMNSPKKPGAEMPA
jgi:hypothetical protein